jgi:hypothetical protein
MPDLDATGTGMTDATALATFASGDSDDLSPSRRSVALMELRPSALSLQEQLPIEPL